MKKIYLTTNACKVCFRYVLLFAICQLWLHVSFAQTGNDVVAAWTGIINESNRTISQLPVNGKVVQLRSALVVSEFASFLILNGAGESVSDTATLSGNFSVKVMAQNGNAKSYALQPNGPALVVEAITGTNTTISQLLNKRVVLTGNNVFHFTATKNPLSGSFLELNTTDAWLYFDQIKPEEFANRYLPHFLINGSAPILDSTVRLVQYGQGCVVISQSNTYKPLTVYAGTNQTGTVLAMGLYRYHRAAELGALNKNISSFTLKKGYMAAFSENENGTGASKVYIAADSDLTISKLPVPLQSKVSFVRVFPWRWVTKKGWTNTVEMAETLGAAWTYNWNNERSSTLNAEYVPIRQTQYWPDLAVTNTKKNVTHLLGFNEPDKSDQANMTVSQALEAWPALLESGLRLGSPSVSDGGTNWLYSFMDKADSAGYRVDFVAVHYYRGCQTASQFYSFLKNIHDRTGRPIWVTEFNNGANWTTSNGCPKPTYAQQAATIQSFLNMLDTTSFVERYALYEWVEDTRQMFNTTNPVVLNPAGVVYQGQASPLAYQAVAAFDPFPPSISSPFTPGNLAVVRFGDGVTTQSGANPIYIDEYTGAGVKVQTLSLPVSKQGTNFPIVSSSVPNANSDGTLSLSADGKYLSVLGYNTNVGSTSTNTVAATSTPRSVAIIDSAAVINTASSFNDVVPSHVTRGVIVNNKGLYMAGGSENGIRYAPLGKGTTLASSVIFTLPGGTRKIGQFGGDLYCSQYTAGLSKLYKLTGTPTFAATPTALPGIPEATASTVASGFVLFDMDTAVAGYDLLYYIDETPAPALQKYVFNGTTWIWKGSYTISGLRDNVIKDLTGTLVDSVPVLYGVSFTSLVQLKDTAARYTDMLALTAKTVLDNSNATQAAFRGVAFVPGTRVKTVREFSKDTTSVNNPDPGEVSLEPEINVYPNPTVGELTLEVNQQYNGAIVLLYDARGALVYSTKLNQLKQVIPMRHFSTGLYFLQVRSGKEKVVRRVIKQ